MKRKQDKHQKNTPTKRVRTNSTVENNEYDNKNLSEKVDDFFNKVISKFSNETKLNINYIVVGHALDTLPAFLKALNNMGKVVGVIFKDSHKDSNIVDEVKNSYHILDIDKNKLLADHRFSDEAQRDITNYDNTSKCVGIERINSLVKESEKCIIIDIGGYFSACLSGFGTDTEISKKLIGIVEDTENGHQEYEKIINSTSERIPVYSVARSRMKQAEDYNVGKSIVSAAESMLRKQLKKMLEDNDVIGVIGFGKIGSSIAEHLRQKNVKRLIIYDNDPIRLLLADSFGFEVTDKKSTLLREATMVFCATGNKSLSVADLKSFYSKEVYIASCTSSDKEFDLTGLPKPVSIIEDCYEYEMEIGNKVVLLCNGNAVNFSYNAVLGNYIRAVQAGLLACTIKLALENPINIKKIQELSKEEEEIIARIWLNSFKDMSFAEVDYFKEINFIGRKAEVAEIFRNLNEKTNRQGSAISISIYGKGGHGKTELVKYYAERNTFYYDHIMFIDIDEGLDREYKKVAIKFNIITTGKTVNQLKKEIYSKMSNKKLLIIYDNISQELERDIKQDIEIISSYCKSKVHVICISENKLTFTDKECEIQGFSKQDVIDYFRAKKQGTDDPLEQDNLDKKITELNNILGNNPLILEKAVAYMNATKLSVSNYIVSLKFQEDIEPLESVIKKILERILPKLEINEPQNISNAFRLFKMQLLLVISHLSGKKITSQLCSQWFEDTYHDYVLTAINEFCNYALLKPFGEFYIIHSRVQNAIRDIIFGYDKGSEENKQPIEFEITKFSFYQKLIRFVEEKVFPYEYYKASEGGINFVDRLQHVINVLEILTHSSNQALLDKDTKLALCKILCKVADFYLNEYRNYELSYKYYDISNKINSEDPMSLLGLAITTYLIKKSAIISPMLGNLEQKVNESINLFKKETEKDIWIGLRIADAKIMLSFVYRQMHKYNTSNNVYLLKAQGELNEAINMITDLSNKKGLKEDQINRIRSLYFHANGSVSYALENFSEAEANFKKALNIRKKLGEEHPDLARTRHRYSKVLLKLNIIDKAYKHCKKAKDAQERIFFYGHPNLEETKKTFQIIEAKKRYDEIKNLNKSDYSPKTPIESNLLFFERNTPQATQILSQEEDEHKQESNEQIVNMHHILQ